MTTGAGPATRLEWLKTLGVATAVLSAVGALFGYGVALGLSAKFGFSAGVWYTSTLELISLSGEGFLGLLTQLLSRLDRWSVLRWMSAYGLAMATMALVSMGAVFFAVTQQERADRWRRQLAEKMKPMPNRELGFSWALFRRGSAIVVFAALSGFLAIPIVGIILGGLFMLIAIIPVFGFYAGTAYADRVVLEPQNCVSSPFVRYQSNKHTSSQKVGVPCVEVMESSSGESVTGRVIIARAGYVVLFRPDHDDAIVVVLKAGSMRTINVLPLTKTP